MWTGKPFSPTEALRPGLFLVRGRLSVPGTKLGRQHGTVPTVTGLPRTRLRGDLISQINDPRTIASPPSRLGERADELSANVLARRNAPETAQTIELDRQRLTARRAHTPTRTEGILNTRHTRRLTP